MKKQVLGEFGFILDGKLENEAVASIEVKKIVSVEVGTGKVETEDYLECFIKWDGCAHFYFGEKIGEKRDSYLHICDPASFQNHANLMKELWIFAFELMGREPEDAWTLE